MSLRVTQNAVTSLMLAGLQSSSSRLSTLEQQLSSGRRISKPSDDPVGTGQAMLFNEQIARTKQYQRNANDGLAWLGIADNALQTGVNILQRLQVLTTQAANTGTADATARASILEEVKSLKEQMLAVANTTYQNRPIFGGTTSSPVAYAVNGSGTVVYQGDTGSVLRTVGDNVQVKVNIDAAQAFGPPGNDVFTMFDTIASDLQNNPGNLSNDLSLIAGALDRMTSAQATEGAAYNRITAMNNAAGQKLNTLTGNLSDVQDVDTAQAVTELTMQQVSYQASLAAMARVLQMSLTDFLR
ncbi:flagellar hook-associated protein 3 [Acidothermus cellulolyticus 11B]|jgi:flagellar hook-associated protein 3 FlgL|uniref:Flagellar hook-associated protein 3 n=1 Tax=Acidothermus cellulolyticus (strain ATCC 43068 / DSM 8971 / 11B) TaxID=351607 RepID=A0LT44_ACIC1|nr:flagellar hook-associated protein FlgL [Acidothermus cellulolyticus]ABK52604.1 flagellar hook-associated protein 3 [Acidothermus cellulolyticus 11B]